MSLAQYHASYGFDSLQKESFWYDDFAGDSVKDYWTVAGASAVVVDGVTGAALRLTTGAVSGNSAQIHWGDKKSLIASKNVAIETRMKLSSIETEYMRIQLLNGGADYFRYFLNALTVPVTWTLQTAATAGGGDTKDSEVYVDTEWHNYRMQVHTHGAVHLHFSIDDAPTSNSPMTTGVTLLYLQPYMHITTNENVAKSVYIDYIAWRQQR